MRETEDKESFKDIFLDFLTEQDCETFREVVEAIRQMYGVELYDVIEQIFEEEGSIHNNLSW